MNEAKILFFLTSEIKGSNQFCICIIGYFPQNIHVFFLKLKFYLSSFFVVFFKHLPQNIEMSLQHIRFMQKNCWNVILFSAFLFYIPDQ